MTKKKNSSLKKGKKEDKKKLEIETIKKENIFLKNNLLRMQADFDNYKKRTLKETKSIIENANINLIKELLPSIDSLKKATKIIKDEGLILIYKNLMNVLKKQGLKEIDCKNKAFDINLHEAVMTVKGKGKDNIIVDEVEKGYTFLDKVIRHSKVIVNKKN